MTVLAFNTASNKLNKIAGLAAFKSSKRTVSVMHDLLRLTMSKANLESSNRLVQQLSDLQDFLPTENIPGKTLVNKKELLKKLEQVKGALDEKLTSVNLLLHTVSTLLNLGDKNAEIENDDDVMIGFLSNMAKSKRILIYITTYLKTYIDIQYKKLEPRKTMSYNELLSLSDGGHENVKSERVA